MRATMRREIARPSPVPPNLRVVPLGLLERLEHPRLRFRRDTDTGVADRKADLVRRGAGRRRDRGAAAFGELHRIAGEIEQHLAQPRRIADHAAGQALVDRTRDLDALRLRARAEQLDDVLDQRAEREGPRLEVEPARLDLGEIENILDQREQRVAGGLHRLGVGRSAPA